MDDGSSPTHLRDANTVGTRAEFYETGLQRDNFPSPAAQACPFLLATWTLHPIWLKFCAKMANQLNQTVPPLLKRVFWASKRKVTTKNSKVTNAPNRRNNAQHFTDKL